MAGTFDARELIVNFAKDNEGIAALQFIRDDPDGIHFKLFEGHGVINYVYRVQSADNKASVVLKHYEETPRLLRGERLSIGRQELEYNCLKLMNNIQPGSAPEPIHLDKNHNILAMVDMSDWDLLGTQLEGRHVDVAALDAYGKLLGKVHHETSRGNISKDRWDELQKECHRDDMKEFIRSFTCIRPFIVDDLMNKIAEVNREAHNKYVTEIDNLGLKKKMCDLYDEQMCFIHGNCHYKSIFVKDGHVSLFDFEFAFLGHPAYNVSRLPASYVVFYILDETHATDQQLAAGASREQFKSTCLHAIKTLVESYLDANINICKSESSRLDFLSALALFTGHFIFKRGTSAHTTHLIKRVDEGDRLRMMDAGFRIMKGHDKVKTVVDFMELISLYN